MQTETALFLPDNMPKGGKRYANMDQDGKWISYIDKQQCEKTREACTSTGSMLSQANPQHILQGGAQYSKIFINSEKKTMGRCYPFSEHDNRALLQDDIETYNQCLGRKKCLDERRQHNSHLQLSPRSMREVGFGKKDYSIYQTNFLPNQITVCREELHRRRFPKSHLERSREALAAQAGDCYMWFGRLDLPQSVPVNFLSAAIHHSSS